MPDNEDAPSREEYAAVYEQSAPELLRYLLASGMRLEDAQDTLHNSFLVLWEIRNRIAGPDGLKPLWFTVARHRMIDFFRATRRLRPLPPDVDSLPGRETAMDGGDVAYIRGRIAAALDALPADLAECYKLVKISGLSIREAAAMLDATESAVKSRIFRAREKLMAMLADLGDF